MDMDEWLEETGRLVMDLIRDHTSEKDVLIAIAWLRILAKVLEDRLYEEAKGGSYGEPSSP